MGVCVKMHFISSSSSCPNLALRMGAFDLFPSKDKHLFINPKNSLHTKVKAINKQKPLIWIIHLDLLFFVFMLLLYIHSSFGRGG